MQGSRHYSEALQMISVLVGEVLVLVSDFAIIPASLPHKNGGMHLGVKGQVLVCCFGS